MKKFNEKSVTWSNLRCSLDDLDRPALLDLIKDLYTVSVDNQAYIHARCKFQTIPARHST